MHPLLLVFLLVLFALTMSIGGAVISSSLRGAQRDFETAYREATEGGLSPYGQKGGRFPVASQWILVTAQEIELFEAGSHARLDRSSITEIGRTWSGALLLEHTDIRQPQNVVFG